MTTELAPHPHAGTPARPSPDPLFADAEALPATLLPHPNLLVYYALTSLLLGPFFWALLLPYYFRYRTLRYRIDEEGITMRWGILFRREISLTYSRIQDIHLTSNVVERWLGLARIQVQTASGNAGAEMTIEGVQDYERLRDFLYGRMRGVKDVRAGQTPSARPVAASAAPALEAPALEELTTTLRAVAEEVRALRIALTARQGGEDG